MHQTSLQSQQLCTHHQTCLPAFPRFWDSQRRRPVCRARPERSRSGMHTKVTSTTPIVVPKELLRSDYAEKQIHSELPLTVYSVRATTGKGRGAGLSDNSSGVSLCLIGKDGRSVLHRISPVHDPEDAKHEVEQMCQIIDDDSVGADCITSLAQNHTASDPFPSPSPSSYTLPPKQPPAPRMRFQEGTVDELSFLAPELGPLAGVLVGTEHASWQLEELHVSSSRTHHTDRFVCRQLLGVQPGQGACFLSPVPPGAVVYGTGDTQVVLSKEQASTLHSMNMAAYEALKQRLLSTTFLLTASGSWVAGLAAGLDGAIPFAMGGLTGLAYQWLLQQSVDGLVTTVTPASSSSSSSTGSKTLQAKAPQGDQGVTEVQGPDGVVRVQPAAPSPLRPGSALNRLLGGPAARVVFLGAAVAVIASVLCSPESTHSTVALGPNVPLYREHLWRLLVALMGFMTYKVALVSVSLTAPTPQVDLVSTPAGHHASSAHHKKSNNNGNNSN